MATAPAIVQTRFDILSEEMKALHSIENWGTSLFLTAIALLSKQLIDWSIPIPPATTPSYLPQWQIFVLPAALGLVAFCFLRVVNYRIREARREQYVLVNAPPQNLKPWGLVGWSMAFMPLIFGLASSWYFSLTRPDLLGLLQATTAFSVVALIVAIYLFVTQSRKKLPTDSEA